VASHDIHSARDPGPARSSQRALARDFFARIGDSYLATSSRSAPAPPPGPILAPDHDPAIAVVRAQRDSDLDSSAASSMRRHPPPGRLPSEALAGVFSSSSFVDAFDGDRDISEADPRAIEGKVAAARQPRSSRCSRGFGMSPPPHRAAGVVPPPVPS